MRILVVKLSSLGDVAHALPVVADLRAAHPDAVIDWVVEPAFAPLVRRVRGIGETIELPLRRWAGRGWLRAWRSGEVAAVLRRLRRHRYDAIVDLQGLTKSALIAAIARGPSIGLANRTDGAGHEWPARVLATRAIRVEPRSHALDRSRELVAKALGTSMAAPPDFGSSGADGVLAGVPSTIVFVHGTSRADKLWPEASWIELGRRAVQSGLRVALPRFGDEEQARALRIQAGIVVATRTGTAAGLAGAASTGSVDVWPDLPLDALIDRMTATAGVIGVDSGPSHIAVALDLPHVQIYNHPTAWRTGPQARHGHAHQVSVEGAPIADVDAVWQAWLHVRSRVAAGDARGAAP